MRYSYFNRTEGQSFRLILVCYGTSKLPQVRAWLFRIIVPVCLLLVLLLYLFIFVLLLIYCTLVSPGEADGYEGGQGR